tara:strand:- start:26051 stop:26626 length:576 start_codon:yes stop_codon:yes gene_type:complete
MPNPDMNIISRLTRLAKSDAILDVISFQPEYPLISDLANGPFKPIKSYEESIQRNFEFLLLTNPGSWPFDPGKGVGLLKYLFVPDDPLSFSLGALSKKITAKIREQTEKYLKPVELMSAEFSIEKDKPIEDQLNLKIVYAINRSVVVEQKIEKKSGSIKTSTAILDEWRMHSHDRDGLIKTIGLVSDMEEA